MSAADVRHSESQVHLLRPLDEMSAPVKRAMTRWLWDHGITPSTVAVGLPIERDDVTHVLIWREQQPDGSVLKRWRYAAHDGEGLWPAPFPEAVRTAPTTQSEQTSRHA